MESAMNIMNIMNMKQNMTKHHLKRLLEDFAHPDDETFCAGSTFAKYIARGAEVMALSDMPTWFSWKSIYTPLQDWNGFR